MPDIASSNAGTPMSSPCENDSAGDGTPLGPPDIDTSGITGASVDGLMYGSLFGTLPGALGSTSVRSCSSNLSAQLGSMSPSTDEDDFAGDCTPLPPYVNSSNAGPAIGEAGACRSVSQ